MTIGQRIQTRRLQLGLSVDDVAERIGKNRATVYRYESEGIKNMSIGVLEDLARALQTTPGNLLVSDEPSIARKYPEVLEIGTQRFPLFKGIACGSPILMDETIETYVEATTGIKADFVLRCVGTSMEPGIRDGDLVFIRSQPRVETGQIAAVAVDDSATLKRVFFYKQKGVLILKADNPSFQEMIFMGDELEHVRILGKAVALQRDVE